MGNYKFFLLYKITNLTNSKIYIGIHRTNLICDGYFGSSKYLKEDVDRLGKKCFKREILMFCRNIHHLCEQEKKIVNLTFVRDPQTYNKMVGGINSMKMYYSEFSKLGNAQRSFLLRNDVEFQKRFHDSMSQAQRKLRGSKEYSKIRERLQIKMRELNRSGKIGLKRPHTQAEIKNMKQSLAKIQHSQGSKNSQFGTCWIHNGTTNKKVKVTEKELHLNQGWILGRVIKLGLNNVLAS